MPHPCTQYCFEVHPKGLKDFAALFCELPGLLHMRQQGTWLPSDKTRQGLLGIIYVQRTS